MKERKKVIVGLLLTGTGWKAKYTKLEVLFTANGQEIWKEWVHRGDTDGEFLEMSAWGCYMGLVYSFINSVRISLQQMEVHLYHFFPPAVNVLFFLIAHSGVSSALFQ